MRLRIGRCLGGACSVPWMEVCDQHPMSLLDPSVLLSRLPPNPCLTSAPCRSLPSFLLHTTPAAPGFISLIADPQGRTIYTRTRSGTAYQVSLVDAHFDCELSTISSSSTSQAKLKHVQLYSPDVHLDMKLIGKLGYNWQFSWEESVDFPFPAHHLCLLS